MRRVFAVVSDVMPGVAPVRNRERLGLTTRRQRIVWRLEHRAVVAGDAMGIVGVVIAGGVAHVRLLQGIRWEPLPPTQRARASGVR